MTMKKPIKADKPRYCDKCGLGLATAQTTATCPRCADEVARLLDSIHRYEQVDAEEVDQDEYGRVLERYRELRRAGHGPQPYEESSI
jgi:predicted RNA-binding Zn-ribbon protein involved in translation (DUF1610 family)